MIELIINSYFSIFVSIGMSCLLVLLTGLYLIFKKPASNKTVAEQALEPVLKREDDHTTDFDEIAGDDVVSTQLDLARAFIETDNKQSAKQILENVLSQGSSEQQDEARFLLGLI